MCQPTGFASVRRRIEMKSDSCLMDSTCSVRNSPSMKSCSCNDKKSIEKTSRHRFHFASVHQHVSVAQLSKQVAVIVTDLSRQKEATDDNFGFWRVHMKLHLTYWHLYVVLTCGSFFSCASQCNVSSWSFTCLSSSCAFSKADKRVPHSTSGDWNVNSIRCVVLIWL